MTKIVAIIGGVLLMAGVATAGTVSSLGSSSDQTIGSTLPTASVTTVRQDDRAREPEVRGREAEAGEDLRGPCDEAEHANDARCTGTAVAPPATTTVRADDDHHGRNRGPGGGGDDSGHRGHGSHGGHGGDD